MIQEEIRLFLELKPDKCQDQEIWGTQSVRKWEAKKFWQEEKTVDKSEIKPPTFPASRFNAMAHQIYYCIFHLSIIGHLVEYWSLVSLMGFEQRTTGVGSDHSTN